MSLLEVDLHERDGVEWERIGWPVVRSAAVPITSSGVCTVKTSNVTIDEIVTSADFLPIDSVAQASEGPLE